MSESNRISVGLAGGTGYAGQELIRLLSNHPDVRLVGILSRSQFGKPLEQVLPQFQDRTETLTRDADALFSEAELVFTAVPHGQSLPLVGQALEQGCRVIDLGADFRLKEAAWYPRWYGFEHTDPARLDAAVYGLTEVVGERLFEATLVANPGCYPTASLLGLLPGVEAGLIDPASIIIDAKSGISGAGREPGESTHYSHRNESTAAYKVGRHQHTPEIEQLVSETAGRPVRLSFTPQVVPMTRGILAVIYARLARLENSGGRGLTESEAEEAEEQIRDLYRRFYKDSAFVHVLPAGKQPETKWALGTNRCFLAVTVDQRTGRLIVTSAIDNLGKGAAGQAVQNMNRMFGWRETKGIEMTGLYP